MKYYVYTFLVLIGIGMSVNADSIRADGGYKMIGRIGVGDNRGTLCALTVSSSMSDIYSNRYQAIFSQFKKGKTKWVPVSDEFSIQDYSGHVFGSKIKQDNKGAQRKTTMTLFQDDKTKSYKIILHEVNLNTQGSVGKFTVCENMQIK